MVCPKCGSQVSETDIFCNVCGQRLDGTIQYQQVPPVQPVSGILPGSKMIRVSGILFIIIAAFSVILTFAMAGAVRGTLQPVSLVMMLLVNGFAIAMGIVGVLRHSVPSFGLFFIISGSVLIFLGILFIALAGGFMGLGGIVLSILYIVGGAKLRKAAQAPA